MRGIAANPDATANRATANRAMANRDRQRGFALLAVLWAAMMMAIIVGSMMASSRSGALIARARLNAATLSATADAAINGAIARMLDPDPARQPPTDGRHWGVTFDGIPVRLSVQDEAGKIDLNRASEALLSRLLEIGGLSPGQAGVMADRIRQWRSPSASHLVSWARDAAYLDTDTDSGAGYGPRHAPFPSVNELLLVRGMDPQVFARIAPSLTVTSGTPWVDPAYAGRDALLALPGMDNAAVTTALAARRTAAPPGVAFGHAFTITAEIAAAGVRVVRRATIRLTGDTDRPVWTYSWERVTGP